MKNAKKTGKMKTLLLPILLLGILSPLVSCSCSSRFMGIIDILEEGKKMECPKERVEGVETYYVNTFKQFSFTIKPRVKTGKQITGNVVTFDDDNGSIINDGKVINTTYGFFEFSNDFEETTYLASFIKEGTYNINFTVSNIKKSVRVICDDKLEFWDKYHLSMNVIHNWISDIDINSVNRVKFEDGCLGVPLGTLKYIKHTNDREDIENAFNLLSATVVKMEIDYSYYALIGGAYYQYTYYTPNESYAVYVMNNFIFKQVKGEELKIYRIESIPGSLTLDNAYFDGFAFICYGSFAVTAVSLTGGENKTYNYIDELEFELWGDESMDQNEPAYVINEEVFMHKIYIYAENRFKYDGVFYRIASEHDFSSLFI